MVASVINLADCRKRKTKPKQSAVTASVVAAPVLMPMFCGFGWFIVPVVIPMMVSIQANALG